MGAADERNGATHQKGEEMTAEQVLQLHSEGFNRALTQQDYHALDGIYSEMYMLVRPDGTVLNKQQVLKDLREQLRIRSIELEEAIVRVVGSVAILTAASTTVSSRPCPHLYPRRSVSRSRAASSARRSNTSPTRSSCPRSGSGSTPITGTTPQ